MDEDIMKYEILKSLLLLALSSVGEFRGMGNLYANIEQIDLDLLGIEFERDELEKILIGLFISNHVTISSVCNSENSEKIIKISEVGEKALKRNKFFSHIAQNFPI